MKRSTCIEIGAAVTTLAGMFLGSTTGPGIACYVAGNGFWWWFTWERRIWAFVPLNAATLVVMGVNWWRL